MEACAYFCAMDTAFERELPREVRLISNPAALSTRRWRLCVLNVEGALRLGSRPLRCNTLLLPEGVCPEGIRATQVISYGLGTRNSLTLSSMDTHPMLSVQRELTNLWGETVEVQEMILPQHWQRWEKRQMLALAGVYLLCGKI